MINLGLDHLALGQYDRALTYLEPTLQRVEYEAFGAHRWRWKIRLFIGLGELFHTTGNDTRALSYVEAGLREAKALRGKIVARRGDLETAGADLHQAFTVADQIGSSALVYPIAYDLGQWYEAIGKEREAAAAYARAKAAIEHMVTAVEDQTLRAALLQSALAQTIHETVARCSG